jgi:hypothetical protein
VYAFFIAQVLGVEKKIEVCPSCNSLLRPPLTAALHPHGSFMASGDSFAAAGNVAADSYASTPTPMRLLEALATLSEAFESGDTAYSDAAAAAVAEVLSPCDTDADAVVSEKMLREVHAFLSCPSSNQVIQSVMAVPSAVVIFGL